MLQFRLQQHERSEFFQFQGVRTEEYHGEAELQNTSVNKKKKSLKSKIEYFS